MAALFFFRMLLPLLCLILCFGPVLAAVPLDPVPLDRKAAEEAYVNGDFEAVILQLTAYQKEHPEHSREDSIFIARHLAVVHAADPKTVEAGKYWMHRLILLSPTADFSGMYVSEEIERIFARVRKEARARAGGSGRRTWLWIGAGGAALAAAAATWFIVADDGEGDGKTVARVQL